MSEIAQPAVDDVEGPADETWEDMADRLQVFPSPERDTSLPPSPSGSPARESELEYMGTHTTSNPPFSARGGQPDPTTTTYPLPSPPPISTSGKQHLAPFSAGRTMFPPIPTKAPRKQPAKLRPPTPEPDQSSSEHQPANTEEQEQANNEDQEPVSSEEDEAASNEEVEPVPPAQSSTQPSTSRATRRRRWRPGTVALREIKKYQKTTDLLIPRAPFARLVREVIGNVSPQSLRIQREALEGLQEAAECFLIGFLEDCNVNAIHAKRVTIQKKDGDLVKHYLNKFSMGGIKYH